MISPLAATPLPSMPPAAPGSLLVRRRNQKRGPRAMLAATVTLQLLPSAFAVSAPSSSTPSTSSSITGLDSYLGMPSRPKTEVVMGSPRRGDVARLAEGVTSSTERWDALLADYLYVDAPRSLQRKPARLGSYAHTIRTRQAASTNFTYPKPLDTTLSTGFTSLSCPSFIETFIASPEFIECHPFSLLLSTSNAFFKLYRVYASGQSPPPGTASLGQVLDASCNPSLQAQCQARMDAIAAQMQARNACGQDLSSGNTLAQSTLRGLRNYQVMREIGCLQTNGTNNGDSTGTTAPSSSPSASSSGVGNSITGTISLNPAAATTPKRARSPPGGTTPHLSEDEILNAPSHSGRRRGESVIDFPQVSALQKRQNDSSSGSVVYCFEQAVRSSDPDDLYYFYLADGTGLPSGVRSTCDACTQDIMNIYSRYAANTTLVLTATYDAARTLTNSQCGPAFANAATLPKSSAACSPKRSSWPLFFALVFSSIVALFALL